VAKEERMRAGFNTSVLRELDHLFRRGVAPSGDAALLERFLGEAKTSRMLASPHVVRVFEAGTCGATAALAGHDASASPSRGGAPWIAMELLQGEDLRARIHRTGALDRGLAVAVARGVAEALDLAHAHGVVHRDVKPANVFLVEGAPAPLAKVLDFGVAGLADDRSQRAPGDLRGAGFHGTPWYMAPEQVAEGRAVPASDRWALGIVAFRMLTGESYWSPAPLADLLAEIVRGPSLAPTVVVAARGIATRTPLGRHFDAWFARACALEPDRRFASAREEVEALAAALDRDAVEAP
jgi:serine/threonine-protein kinase